MRRCGFECVLRLMLTRALRCCCKVLETLTPPLLGTLVEICGRDQRFVVMSFLQNGLDLQRTQDFIVDTLNTIS